MSKLTDIPTKSVSQIANEMGEDQTVMDLDNAEDPKMLTEYSFTINHQSPWGETFKGTFTNRILTIRQKSLVGAIKARLSNNAPISSLDAYTVQLNDILAHLQVSLIRRPLWAKDMGELLDDEILYKVYQEVSSHEETFHRRKEDQGEDKEKGSDKESSNLASE